MKYQHNFLYLLKPVFLDIYVNLIEYCFEHTYHGIFKFSLQLEYLLKSLKCLMIALDFFFFLQEVKFELLRLYRIFLSHLLVVGKFVYCMILAYHPIDSTWVHVCH